MIARFRLWSRELPLTDLIPCRVCGPDPSKTVNSSSTHSLQVCVRRGPRTVTNENNILLISQEYTSWLLAWQLMASHALEGVPIHCKLILAFSYWLAQCLFDSVGVFYQPSCCS